MTVSGLPDDVLLEIFHFHVDRAPNEDAWYTLVHVCRRWRCIVFASPEQLHLCLVCTPDRLTKNTLAVWPSLPIVISSTGNAQ